MNALLPDLQSAAIDPVRAERMGFAPAYMDMATCQIHVACNANGQATLHHSLEGLDPSFVWARNRQGRAIVLKPSLRAGYVRGGFFYTLVATSRALREWDTGAVD